MRGVAGKPYVNLDKHVDLTLVPELYAELSRNRSCVEPTVFAQPTRILIFRDGALSPELYSQDVVKQYQRIAKLPNPMLQHGSIFRFRKSTSYANYDRAAESYDATYYHLFPKLQEFVKRLPMSEIGRVSGFVSEPGIAGVLHKDHPQDHALKEFIWVRLSADKKFFVYDGAKTYIESTAAFFNVLDFHGADAPTRLTFSIRVDGRFTPELREAIGG